MKPLRLKNPKTPRSPSTAGFNQLAMVAVATPVPHLDGEYSYLTTSDARLGSLVKVPFGNKETLGFITSIEDKNEAEILTPSGKLKNITKIIGDQVWFNSQSLARYRKLAENYGVGLFTVLNLAIPIKTNVKMSKVKYSPDLDISKIHQDFLTSRFGSDWTKPARKTLLIPPLQLWEELLISILMSKKSSTLILLPTERSIGRLQSRLRALGLVNPAILSSDTKIGERADIFQKILKKELSTVIGTRSAALAPFNPERVIILDSGDLNYREKRSPYHRVDSADFWQNSEEIIFLSHAPTLELMADGMPIFQDKEFAQILNQRILTTSTEKLVANIKRNIIGDKKPAILISINDVNFSSSLICSKCRNRLRCECGSPLVLKHLKGSLFCSNCQVEKNPFLCSYCSHGSFLTLKAGGEKWALTLSKNIKDSKIILSNNTSSKEEISHNGIETVFVIATQGSEPLVFSEDGQYLGYDFVVILGGDYGFNLPSLNAVEELRVKWSRILSLANRNISYKYKAIVELDSMHVEFRRLVGRSLDDLYREPLLERKTLALPPYTSFCEIEGSFDALSQVRELLLKDSLFLKPGSLLYPVRQVDGSESNDKSNFRLLMKVESIDRIEIAALIQQLIRLRSAKRLSALKFRMDPDYL